MSLFIHVPMPKHSPPGFRMGACPCGCRFAAFMPMVFNYKPVTVYGNYKIGDRIDVRVKGAEAFALIGEVVQESI
jgi:hypothetical protein